MTWVDGKYPPTEVQQYIIEEEDADNDLRLPHNSFIVVYLG
jgi:hypothetical protein